VDMADAPSSALGVGFSRASAPIEKLDLLDASAVNVYIDKHHPVAIIHCAAERRPDVAQADPAAAEKVASHLGNDPNPYLPRPYSSSTLRRRGS
jgi:dTDP-4-dehydrorhamnose reductase